MATINPKDVEPILRYSVREFRTWLREGLGGYFAVGLVLKDRPFEPLAWVHRTGEEIDDVLSQIYFALDPPARVRFLSALRRLPLDFGDDRGWYPVLREILYLFVNIRETTIAEDVVNAVDCDAFQGLFPEALGVVEMLAPARGVAAAITRLASSTRFPIELATRAFVALCRCDARGWVSHVELLASRLTNVVDPDAVDLDYLRIAFAEIVSIDLVASGIKKLLQSVGRNEEVSGGFMTVAGCAKSKRDILRVLYVLFSGRTLTFEYFKTGMVVVANRNSHKAFRLDESTLKGDRFIRNLNAQLRRKSARGLAQELALRDPTVAAIYQDVNMQLTFSLSVEHDLSEKKLETLLDAVSA